MYEQKYNFTLTGATPLIMHWDNIDWADQVSEERGRIKEKTPKLFKAGDDRCPPDTWRGYAYNDGDVITVPTDNLRSCLLKASARIILKAPKTYKELSQCAIMFDDLFLPLMNHGKPIAWKRVMAIDGPFSEHASAVQKLGFRLLVKRAKVGQTKHVRVRPMFSEWSVSGSFTVLDEQLTPGILEKIWTNAAHYIGLCDWRPGSPKSPGPYGRFVAKLTAA